MSSINDLQNDNVENKSINYVDGNTTCKMHCTNNNTKSLMVAENITNKDHQRNSQLLKRDLKELPLIRNDIIKKNNKLLGLSNIDKFPENYSYDISKLQETFINKFTDKFKTGLDLRRILSGRPYFDQLLCIIDEEGLFRNYSKLIDNIIDELNLSNKYDEIIEYIKNIRASKLHKSSTHSVYDAKTILISNKVIDNELDESISSGVDAYCYPPNGFEKIDNLKDKKIEIIGYGLLQSLCSIFDINLVKSPSKTDILARTSVINFGGYNYDYYGCRYVPDNATQVFVALQTHAIESRKFFKNIDTYTLECGNGNQTNLKISENVSATYKSIDLIAMDKFTNYDDTAQPLSGDIDAFLKNFFRDNSALLFSRSFRRFVFGKKMLPIYMYLSNNGHAMMCFKISNYIIHCNKNSFMFIEFTITADPAIIDLIKKTKDKYFIIDSLNHGQLSNAGGIYAMNILYKLNKMVSYKTIAEKFNPIREQINPYLDEVVKKLNDGYPGKRKKKLTTYREGNVAHKYILKITKMLPLLIITLAAASIAWIFKQL